MTKNTPCYQSLKEVNQNTNTLYLKLNLSTSIDSSVNKLNMDGLKAKDAEKLIYCNNCELKDRDIARLNLILDTLQLEKSDLMQIINELKSKDDNIKSKDQFKTSADDDIIVSLTQTNQAKADLAANSNNNSDATLTDRESIPRDIDHKEASTNSKICDCNLDVTKSLEDGQINPNGINDPELSKFQKEESKRKDLVGSNELRANNSLTTYENDIDKSGIINSNMSSLNLTSNEQTEIKIEESKSQSSNEEMITHVKMPIESMCEEIVIGSPPPSYISSNEDVSKTELTNGEIPINTRLPPRSPIEQLTRSMSDINTIIRINPSIHNSLASSIYEERCIPSSKNESWIKSKISFLSNKIRRKKPEKTFNPEDDCFVFVSNKCRVCNEEFKSMDKKCPHCGEEIILIEESEFVFN